MEIRAITLSDSRAFLDLLLRLDNETKFMMFEPGERDSSEKLIENHLSNLSESIGAFIGAFEHEVCVGFISISRGCTNRAKHSAYVVMGVASSFTGKGIGKLLFAEGEAWAKKHNITRLELTVMTHNINALKLYEKMGFENEGLKKNSLLVDGNYVDEYYMGKIFEGGIAK
ncbi:MAG: GNAT family N-acetyltransferase [Defluviitaleaceae bacterium]|nr:GNAT family N-acetyltransferase [Defluviitaleaceae bacterium]